jgi:hypothetical protein
MANTFVPRQLSSPALLQRVAPHVLIEFLKRYAEFFKHEKAMPTSTKDIDYDKLSVVLRTPSEKMPPALMADIFYWDEVAEMGNIEDLTDIADKYGIKFSDKVTCAEAALLVRMQAPQDLEDLHSRYRAHDLLCKKKRFMSYFAKPAHLPKWTKPSSKILEALSVQLDMWYDAQHKGRGIRISVVEKADAAWFIVRHGGTYKGENALENGEPKMLFFRPETYDLLIYYYKQGELAIYNESNSVKERCAYCTYLGKTLFDDSDFFQKDDLAKYTLEPLRNKGRAALDCSEIEGLKSARLHQLRYTFGGENNHRITHVAEDVFTGLEDLNEVIPDDAKLVSMAVKITPDNDLGIERTVKLHYPNVSVYDHESDAEIAHQLLEANGFILKRPGAAGHV